MLAKGIELIQQWQALGRVPPELLRDEAFEHCKKAGLTSLQSYVCWAEIENQPGIIDFSTYDELVEKIKTHGLKWVPLFIMGPYYATPMWFQRTKESVYVKCLEHGRESKVQSIWNPYLPRCVERFLRLVGKHYANCGVLESIELGISGNWGEALYLGPDGFLRPRDFHTHSGWWCGDRYAMVDFQKFVCEEYGSIQKLNIAWNKNFRDFREVTYPRISPDFVSWFIESMKNLIKFGIKFLLTQKTIWDRNTIGVTRLKYPSFENLKNNAAKQRRWLDFVHWYLNSMTDWADFWIKMARKHFPKVEIYLATGGDGNPFLGADFSAQTKIAAKYGAGIRITNQSDDYAESFVLTRLVASASRYYGTYFTTEEALFNQPRGVTMRIFDATTSGAKGVYFKNIVGGDVGVAYGGARPDPYILGKPTQNMMNFTRNIHHLTGEKPLIEAAIFFPNTAIALDPGVLWSVYKYSSQLRDVLDFDFVDENFIADNALERYRFFIILNGNLMSRRIALKIKRWVEKGGILICTKHADISIIESQAKFYDYLGLQPERIAEIVRGYGILSRYKGQNYLEFVKQAVYNQEKRYPWIGIPEIDDEWDCVYATRFESKIMYFNAARVTKMKLVQINNLPERKGFKLKIQPHSIMSVDLTVNK